MTLKPSPRIIPLGGIYSFEQWQLEFGVVAKEYVEAGRR
jgi:hypothetical protein